MAKLGSGTPAGPNLRKKLTVGLGLLILLVIGGIALYTFAMLSIAYSDGDRAGTLQKFSRRGWVCKTYEGELAMSITPGMGPVIWKFSVRDPAVATKINEALGRHVALHYTEHRGVPTDCFAESDYYVDGVRVID